MRKAESGKTISMERRRNLETKRELDFFILFFLGGGAFKDSPYRVWV